MQLLRRKYRIGKRYKSQRSAATGAGGDAHLNKHTHHKKLNTTQKAKLAPQPLRVLHFINGKGRMVNG